MLFDPYYLIPLPTHELFMSIIDRMNDPENLYFKNYASSMREPYIHCTEAGRYIRAEDCLKICLILSCVARIEAGDSRAIIEILEEIVSLYKNAGQLQFIGHDIKIK